MFGGPYREPSPPGEPGEDLEIDTAVSRLRWFAIAACFCVASGIVLAFITSCAAAKPGAEAAYLAEQLACIDAAETRSEATSCREKVKARWAVDGGK
jgi:hypothetical protein